MTNERNVIPNPEHKYTERCGYDRNASHNAGHYVCGCGWENPEDALVADPDVLSSRSTESPDGPAACDCPHVRGDAYERDCAWPDCCLQTDERMKAIKECMDAIRAAEPVYKETWGAKFAVAEGIQQAFDAVNAIYRSPTASRPAGTCLWRDNEEFWSTSCGQDFTFLADGPKENGFNYCHHCGKPIEEESDDD